MMRGVRGRNAPLSPFYGSYGEVMAGRLKREEAAWKKD